MSRSEGEPPPPQPSTSQARDQEVPEEEDSSESEEEWEQGMQTQVSLSRNESALVSDLRQVGKYTRKMRELQKKFQSLILPESGEPARREEQPVVNTDLMSVFESGGESTQISPRETGFELPVFAHVPATVREKIGMFGYMDLSTMLPRESCGFEEDELVQKKKASGEIVWTTKKSYVPITSLEIWEKAFGIYALLRFHPNLAVPLRQYEYTIRRWAAIYPWINVYNYDRQFRKAVSENPQKKWDKVDQELAAIEPRTPKRKCTNRRNKIRRELERERLPFLVGSLIKVIAHVDRLADLNMCAKDAISPAMV